MQYIFVSIEFHWCGFCSTVWAEPKKRYEKKSTPTRMMCHDVDHGMPSWCINEPQLVHYNIDKRNSYQNRQISLGNHCQGCKAKKKSKWYVNCSCAGLPVVVEWISQCRTMTVSDVQGCHNGSNAYKNNLPPKMLSSLK